MRAQAATNFSGDLSVLDASLTDADLAVDRTAVTAAEFSISVEGLGVAIGAATAVSIEAAGIASDAARQAIEASEGAAMSADRARQAATAAGGPRGSGFGPGGGFAGTGPGQSPGPAGDPGGATGPGIGAGPSPDPSQGGKGMLHGGWIGVPGYAPGGWVTDGVWGRDSVMAMLARDEFVLNAGAANYAPGFTEALNRDPARALAAVAAGGDEGDSSGPEILAAILDQNRLLRRQNELLERIARAPGRVVGAVS